MITFPNAKINIGLRVTGKRPDGYHNIETCFVPVDWYDVLEVMASDHTTLHVTGLHIAGPESENLCTKAWRMLQHDFDIPGVEIHLHKVIPMGGGLGGGSSDAAFMLRMLSDHFNLGLGEELLTMYAARLGSDCPFFIHNVPSLAEGRGDILEPVDIDLSPFTIAVVYPEVHIETARAYAGIHPAQPSEHLRDILVRTEAEQWKQHVFNDFEKSVFDMVPELSQIKRQLYDSGAVYAAMSGSGSSIFGLFRSEPRLQFPRHYRVWIGKALSGPAR